MRPRFILLAFALLSVFPAQPGFSAIKYKRFPHCSAGVVMVHTCECHAAISSRYHLCHAGGSCDTYAGTCHQ
jgi:hypothetical protein